MKRTIYRDGIEVDASDLNFTESSKIEEILQSRRAGFRYGVIRGLSCSITGNRINIDVGEVLFRNGEIGVLTSPITNVSGASSEAGVSTFVGVRLIEVQSQPKPHEIDPIVADVRAETRMSAELFVATSSDVDARNRALQDAISAELHDGDFVLLAEIVGTGTGIGAVPAQNTPIARSRGGVDPFRDDPKTSTQVGALVAVYDHESYNRHPIASAEDHIHRSLIGSGIPNPRNPHGMTLADIGGDALLDRALTQHQYLFHANGIIGMEPSNNEWAPASGSFAWSLDGIEVAVNDLANVADSGAAFDEVIHIFGKSAIRGQITTIPDGVTAPKITFSGAPAGLYYIVIRWSSDDTQPVFTRITKSSYDASCPVNNGVRSHYNNAIYTTLAGDREKCFYVIGLVKWGGSAFVPLSTETQIRIPSGSPFGELTYRNDYPAGHPFRIPSGAMTLDLRRWGTVSNEDVQRRSIRLDRLVERVVSESDFVAHSGVRIVNGSPIVVSGTGLRANASSIDNTVLKHLTDFDANTLFNHRRRVGTEQHGLASHSGALDVNSIPVDENARNSGFQSAYDKWKQDNLTMTILSFADLKTIDAPERAMGNAAAVSATSPLSVAAGGYVFYRRGVLKNFTGHLAERPVNAARSIKVKIVIRPIGSFLGPGLVAGTQVWQTGAGGTGYEVLGVQGAPAPNNKNVSFTNTAISIPVNASFAAPMVVQCTRLIDVANPNWVDLTVTCEYHYGS